MWHWSKRKTAVLGGVVGFVFIMILIGMSNARIRFIYYRHKDAALTWVTENAYLMKSRKAGREVRIVCLGDSMTDDIPEQALMNRLFLPRPTWITIITRKLRETYPDERIFVYNHGARSMKIATALERMENPYKREDSYYDTWIVRPSVRKLKPNMIILESHAYMDHDTNYEEYATAVKEIVSLGTKQMGAQIYFLATICPDSTDLKKPYALYVNNPQKRIREAELIRVRMEDFIALGKTLGIPIIDVYHETAASPRQFIKSQDMVHPSFLGHVLIARKVFETISKSSVFNMEDKS